MKSRFVKQLKLGVKLEDEPFLLQDVIQGTTKNGAPFLRAILKDNSGQINSVYWDVPASVTQWVSQGKVALVDGKVSQYRKSLQIVISNLTFHPSPNMVDFLPTTSQDADSMVADLRQIITSLAEPYQSLVTTLLLADDFLPRFAAAPAAKRMHHAVMGGLLAHVLSMAQVASMLTEHYEQVDYNLLMSGVLLHDIGKVIEYDVTAGISISNDGHLVGHIPRGLIMIEKTAASMPDFPSHILHQINHLILSHHGRLEWGSPVTPKTLEAILLHQIDLLDSRVQGYIDFIAQDQGQDNWTQNVSPMFGTYLQRPQPNNANKL